MALPDIPQLDTDVRTLSTSYLPDTVGMDYMLICLPVTPTAFSICHGAQTSQPTLPSLQAEHLLIYVLSQILFCMQCVSG